MDHLSNLRTTLNGLASVPDSEWAFLAARVRVRNVEKHGFFLRQDEYPSTLAYVERGLFRVFFHTKDGDEKTHAFRPEGCFLSGLSPFLQRRRAPYSIEAMEDSQLLCIDVESITTLRGRHPCWETTYARYTERLFLEKEKREREFLSDDAATRYRTFMTENPVLEGRIPQYLIASYLGITPVALSRIRGRRN